MASRDHVRRARIALAALGAGLAGCGGDAAPAPDAPDGWVRPAEAGAMTAAYFTLRNTGAAPMTVIGVRTEGAVSSTLHETVETDGASSMRPLDSLMIAPGDSAAFVPRGRHVMIHGLSRALVAGDTVLVRLARRGADSLVLRLPVLDR